MNLLASKKRKVILLVLLLLIVIALFLVNFFVLQSKNNQPITPKFNAEKIASDIKAVIEKNPQSIDSVWTEKLYSDAWKQCYDLNNDNANRENGCEALIKKLYQDYQSFKDPAFYDTAKEVYNYAAETFDKYTFNTLKNNVGAISK